MDVARHRIVAEQRGEPAKLHRLPDGKSGDDGEANHDDDAGVEQALHGVVMAESVAELETERSAYIAAHVFETNRPNVPTKMPGQDRVAQISDAVSEQHPHRAEMPCDTGGQPAS